MLLGYSTLAIAAKVYLNGVEISALRSQSFGDVDVILDARGDVFITSDRYAVEASEPPVAPLLDEASRVPAGVYWLVTENESARGHQVDVRVNGVLVRQLTAGAGQVILDLQPWLRLGPNQLALRSTSVDPSGGSFYVYVGVGSNQRGTVEIGTPLVQFGLGADRSTPRSQEYTLTIE